MNLNQYQSEAKKTALYPTDGITGLVYTILGLCGESGELANKIKKIIRGDGELTEEKKLQLKDELGDCLWYVAMIANELGFSLKDVASDNVNKLNARMTKGTIKGSGDNR